MIGIIGGDCGNPITTQIYRRALDACDTGCLRLSSGRDGRVFCFFTVARSQAGRLPLHNIAWNLVILTGIFGIFFYWVGGAPMLSKERGPTVID